MQAESGKEKETGRLASQINYLCKSPEGTERSKVYSADLLHPFSASQYRLQNEHQSPQQPAKFSVWPYQARWSQTHFF